MHAHVQIEYTNDNGDQVESLVGFDPTSKNDREFVHSLLDEYLDYLAKRFKRVLDGKESGIPGEGGRYDMNHFEVSDQIDP